MWTAGRHGMEGGGEQHNKPMAANVTLGEALRMAKFWALVTAAITFFLYGGQAGRPSPSAPRIVLRTFRAVARTHTHIYTYILLTLEPLSELATVAHCPRPPPLP